MHMAEMSVPQDRCLFRAMVNSKSGQKLRKSGSVSYTRMRELVLEKLAALGHSLGCIACVLGEHPLLLMQACLIVCSKCMVDGAAKMPKMAT